MGLVGEKERAYLETTRTHNFLKEKFRDYYANATLKTPPRFTSREWGFLGWSGKLMNRHQSFRSKKDLQSYLSKYGPKHAYHSVAYYSIPNAPTMKDKSWQGADLIFDLDADHIPNAIHNPFTNPKRGIRKSGFHKSSSHSESMELWELLMRFSICQSTC